MYTGTGKRKRIYSSKYALTSICTCTKCSDIYRRIAWNNRGKRSNVWRCCTRVENGPSACDARTIQESDLQQATVEAINQLINCSDPMLDVLMQNIRTALADDNTGELGSINELISVKQRDLVRLAQAKKDYTILADEIDRLKEKKQQLLVDKAETEGFKLRIGELEAFLKAVDHELTDYDEAMVRKYIREIKVYKDHLQVCFKTGIDVDIDR